MTMRWLIPAVLLTLAWAAPAAARDEARVAFVMRVLEDCQKIAAGASVDAVAADLGFQKARSADDVWFGQRDGFTYNLQMISEENVRSCALKTTPQMDLAEGLGPAVEAEARSLGMIRAADWKSDSGSPVIDYQMKDGGYPSIVLLQSSPTKERPESRTSVVYFWLEP